MITGVVTASAAVIAVQLCGTNGQIETVEAILGHGLQRLLDVATAPNCATRISLARVFQRRHHRRHYDRPFEDLQPLCHRSQLSLHLQGQSSEGTRCQQRNVRYVLEGSVRKANNQVRITAQLIDATTGEPLWAERYDRPLTNIFALQDEIVKKIVTTLKLQPTLWEQGVLVRKSTDNSEAYDYFLRGREAYNRA